MNTNILVKLIQHEKITKKEIEGELRYMCNSVILEGCNCECLIYKEVLTDEQKLTGSCPYLKSTKKMLKVLKDKYLCERLGIVFKPYESLKDEDKPKLAADEVRRERRERRKSSLHLYLLQHQVL